jgi:glutathione synthase/RimK-type ligase-like ATP-grasp enzyme
LRALRSILVFSTSADDETREVLAALSRRGCPTTLLDLAEFPQRWASEFEVGPARESWLLSHGNHRLELEDVSTVWWRRPEPFQPAPELTDPAHRARAFRQCEQAMAGMWQALDATWVNDPTREAVADRKLYQLAVARRLGLAIPRTLVTNDPTRAREFAAGLSPTRVITKGMRLSRTGVWQTRWADPGDANAFEGARYAPAVFQEYVGAEADFRVTIVGDQIFAAEIDASRTAYPLDWRVDYANARVTPASLPESVTAKLRALMKALGLVYGAADLRRTSEGDYVFLEVNPSGEWLFVERRTGQPITQAVADLLARLARR